MTSRWLRLLIAALLHSVLADPDAPPAPVNARIISTNFKHVLCWDPAPGTAPETLYVIQTRVRGRRWKRLNSSDTCLKVTLKNHSMYSFAVQASFNSTLSPPSNNITFYPARQSQIGAPLLSLASCGNCIQINISLPQADKDSNISDIQKFYKAFFTVLWRKKNDVRLMTLTTKNRSVTLSNVDKGVEYCVQVKLMTHLNELTEPSAWHCLFSSQAPGGGVPGAVSALLSMGILLLTSTVGFLGYTGFLWKLQVALPAALTTALQEGLTLIPERIIPGPVALWSERSEDRKYNSPTSPPADTTDCHSGLEDEDEKDCMNVYMDRDPGLSSGHQVPPDGPPASEASGSLTVGWRAAPEVLQEGVDPDETKPAPPGGSPALLWGLPVPPEGSPALLGGLPVPPEGSPALLGGLPVPPEGSPALLGGLPVPPEGSPALLGGLPVPPEGSPALLGVSPAPQGVQDQATEEKELQYMSSHVDLFSVTLASLAAEEVQEEKEEQGEDEEKDCNFFREYSLKPQFSSDLRQTLSDSQTKAGYESLETAMLQLREDLSATQYEDEVNILIQEEEEEEQLFTGYLGHQ